jgi:ATPase subunit of ABC transporter with duplicated ATPase domains
MGFKANREVGNNILFVTNLTKKPYFENLSFVVKKNDKIAFISDNTLVTTTLFNILAGREEADSGTVKWGVTTQTGYLFQENSEYFNKDISLVDWLRQFSPNEQAESFIRGWLGRMLFSGEESLKKANVLSGGEKVRCLFAKLMLEGPNVLVLEDPTNHLDLESITALNEGMSFFKGNILFTSHDAELLDTVANRYIYINGSKIGDKEMAYDEFMELIEG